MLISQTLKPASVELTEKGGFYRGVDTEDTFEGENLSWNPQPDAIIRSLRQEGKVMGVMAEAETQSQREVYR